MKWAWECVWDAICFVAFHAAISDTAAVQMLTVVHGLKQNRGMVYNESFLPGRHEVFPVEKNPTRPGKIQVLFCLCVLEMSQLPHNLKSFIGQTHAKALAVGKMAMLLS